MNRSELPAVETYLWDRSGQHCHSLPYFTRTLYIMSTTCRYAACICRMQAAAPVHGGSACHVVDELCALEEGGGMWQWARDCNQLHSNTTAR